MEAAKYEYRNLVMQRVFEGRTEQEMLAEQMTQARFTPQQAWFQEPARRKDARLYELLKHPPPALPSRAADGAAPSGAIDAPDGGGAAAPPRAFLSDTSEHSVYDSRTRMRDHRPPTPYNFIFQFAAGSPKRQHCPSRTAARHG